MGISTISASVCVYVFKPTAQFTRSFYYMDNFVLSLIDCAAEAIQICTFY